MKPMLAEAAELDQLKYPLYASPKIDGVRAMVIDGVLRSRSLKTFPNAHTQQLFSHKQYEGLDGELVVGDPWAHDCYRQTQSATSRIEGEPDVKFHVFDKWNRTGAFKDDFMLGYYHKTRIMNPDFCMVEQHRVENERELLEYESLQLDRGFEGLILRSPDSGYKFGRSTVKQGWLLKLKRFVDSEAEILSVYEEMENTNEAKTNALGRTERSSAQAGLVGKGRAGGFRLRDTKSGVEFGCGTGLNDDDREFYWRRRKEVVGKLVKYKSFAIGVKDLPRHPVYLGPREKWDMS